VIVVVYVRFTTMFCVQISMRPVAVLHRRVVMTVAVCCREVFPPTDASTRIGAAVRYVDVLVNMLQGFVGVPVDADLALAPKELQTREYDATDSQSQQREFRGVLAQP
jgi:hypothetical protein